MTIFRYTDASLEYIMECGVLGSATVALGRVMHTSSGTKSMQYCFNASEADIDATQTLAGHYWKIPLMIT